MAEKNERTRSKEQTRQVEKERDHVDSKKGAPGNNLCKKVGRVLGATTNLKELVKTKWPRL
jgi:hypothetical protein